MKKSKLKYLLFVGILLISIYFGSPLNVMAVTRKSNPSPSCPSGTYCIKEKKTYTYKCPDTSYSQPGGNKSPTCIKNGKSVKGTKITHTTKTTVPKDQCPTGFHYTRIHIDPELYGCSSSIWISNDKIKIKLGETKTVELNLKYNNAEVKNINLNKIKFEMEYSCDSIQLSPVVKNKKLYVKIKTSSLTQAKKECIKEKWYQDSEEDDAKNTYAFMNYKVNNDYYRLDLFLLHVDMSNTSTTSNQSKSSSSSSTKKSTSSTKKSKKITIKCNDSSFSVDKGKKKTIGYTVTGATSSQKKNVSFKSMNTKIATVGAKGKVTGKKVGSTKIKITVGGVSKKCNVTVNKENTQTNEENVAEDTVNDGLNDINQNIDDTDSNTTNDSSNNVTLKTIKCPSKTPTVKVGKTKKISYTKNPSNASTNGLNIIVKGGSKDNIKITSTSPLKVKGLKKGTGKIVFKYNGKTTTCKIKVEKASSSSKKSSSKKSSSSTKVTNITISGNKQMKEGDKKTYIANVSPAKANQNVSWKSSDKKVATVNSQGQVTAKKAGTVTITATSKENSKIKGTKKVAIIEFKKINRYGPTDKVESISIPSTKTISVDSKAKLKVTYTPSNPYNLDVTWKSSNKKIVTVDSDGTIVGHKTGTATVTVTSKDNKNATSKCVVTVTKKVNVKSVSVSPKSATISVGQTKTIVATVSPSTVYNETVTYKSSNEKVATVNSSGQITGKKKGSATITVKSKSDTSKKATVKVTVKKAKNGVASIQTDNVTMQETLSVAVGNKKKIKITGAQANEFKFKSSNTKVATIDSDGTVVGKKKGTATITATLGGTSSVKKTCKVTVTKKVDVTSITITSDKTTIAPEKSTTLNVQVLPETASNKNVTWKSSNEKVATVKDGKVTGHKKGTATITTTSKSDTTKKATIKIKVDGKYPAPNIKVDKIIDLPDEDKPKNGKDKKFYVIYFKFNIKGADKLQVKSKNPSSVSFSKNPKTEKSAQIAISEERLNKNEKNDKKVIITFVAYYGKEKSEPTVIKVYKSGNKLKYDYGDNSENMVNETEENTTTEEDTTTEETTYGEWETENEDLMSTTLLLGGTTYVPWYEDGQFDQSEYTYAFTDNTIASINSTTGLITALKTGETYLKLISNYDSTTFRMLKITVIESANTSSGSGTSSSENNGIPVDSITVPQDTIKIYKGDTAKIQYIISPENASNKSVTYKSSDEKIAKVNKNGKVTGVKKGTATITVKSKSDTSKKAKVTIKVVKKQNVLVGLITGEKVTKVTIKSDKKSLKVGSTLKLKATISPSSLEDEKVIWVSSDKSIATVSQKGVVTGVKAGTVIITAKANSDNEIKDSIKLTVKKKTTTTTSSSNKKFIFVGDSRFVGMQNAVNTGSDIFIGKVGEGYNYFVSNESNIKSKETSNSILIIGFGVNDLGNVDKYIKYVNNAGFKSKIYFLTVNPVEEGKGSYSVKNSSIKSFNNKLKDGAKKYKVIDTYSYLVNNGYETTDGLHYNNATYKKIYNYVKSKVNGSSTSTSSSSSSSDTSGWTWEYIDE